MAEFKSEDGRPPQIDPSKLDHIAALVTSFEQKDLRTTGALSLFYDKHNDYVFFEITADVNGQRIIDDVMGYDKEKVINLCKNIFDYFNIKYNKEGDSL